MSLLIKGGDVVDGLGGAPVRADILLVSDRIAAIGDLPAYKADKVINASGSFVIPAPIDLVSLADKTSIDAIPSFDRFLQEGIGTVVMGGEGTSRFPAPYGEPEPSWRFEGYPNKNSDWKNAEEFLKAVSFSKPGVSFGSFVGWESLRGGVTEKWRELSDSEISVISYALSQSVSGGACGLSFGSCSLSNIPISDKEFSGLMRSLSDSRGSCVFSLRYDDDPLESSKLVKKVGAMGIPVMIAVSPLVSSKDLKKFILEIKEIPEKTRLGLVFSPSGSEVISLRDILPQEMRHLSEPMIMKELQGTRMKARLAKIASAVSLPEAVISFSPRTPFLKGKSVSEFIANREIAEDRVISKLISVAGVNTFIRFSSTVAPELVSESMSFAASFGCPESYISNVIESCDKLGVSLASAVRKMSSLPSEMCGFEKRGSISEGGSASLVIIKDKKISHSIIEGSISFSDEKTVEINSGRLAKRHV
mgnify:CR=1 FL=1